MVLNKSSVQVSFNWKIKCVGENKKKKKFMEKNYYLDFIKVLHICEVMNAYKNNWYWQKLKDLKFDSTEDKKRDKFANGLVWFVSTGRNALVVLLCTVLAALLYQRSKEPFKLTGTVASEPKENNSCSLDNLAFLTNASLLYCSREKPY